MTVFDAAKILVAKAASQGESGTTVTQVEMRNIVDRLGGTYPTWLADLLTTLPLCRLEIGWQEDKPEADYPGVTWMFWSDAENVLGESECHPGCEILAAGYVNVASCGMGSGNPYFINVHDGIDPPLYRIYHDVGREAQSILAGGRIHIASRLSDFLMNAELRSDPRHT